LEPATIPISPGLVRLYTGYMFDEYGEVGSDYVFVNLFAEPYGAPLRYQAVNQLVRRLRARTGIDFSLHMLRHSRATDLLRHGVPIEVVSRLLTHRSSTTTSQTYLHLDVDDLRAELTRHGVCRRRQMTVEVVTARPALTQVTAGGDLLEQRYAADRWHADELGVAAARGRGTVNFCRIPRWLREPVKQWARWRITAGWAFNTIRAAELALNRFSGFLAACQPPVRRPEQLDRPLLQRYLAWLATQPVAEGTKELSRVFLRGFLEDNRRHHWAPDIPADAVLYPDELRFRRQSLPRFIPEYLMNQLDSEANLDQLRPAYRRLVVLLAETGLRSGDACVLPADPLLTDSAGWPCLRFHAHKMRAEFLLPLSTRGCEAVRGQQQHNREHYPAGTPWLFPSRDPQLPVPYDTERAAFADWQTRIGLHDEAGKPVRVTLHQYRHTLGTRLINSGVPQHVVQRLLCHASPAMTAVYAQLHDSTIRAEFERYCQTRVDVEGRLLGFDPAAATADAEWVKHRLARAADTLPNGHCGRPPQQDCPHPNACLTCPDFHTSVEFLPVHQQQAALTRDLIAAADSAGRTRLADNHRAVLINLEKIVASLEALRPAGTGDA